MIARMTRKSAKAGSKMVDLDRRADAHAKIKLGGLIIKAGLSDLPPETLMGALMDVRIALDNNPAITAHWKAQGLPEMARKTGGEK